MRPEAAQRRVDSFGKRFGASSAHLYLAYHAAFPLALTPDLLYRIWGNFQRDIHGQLLKIPWIAVADLLLSNLCKEVGHELYEMDLAVRNVLLARLQEDSNFGKKRINELSDFLLAYIRKDLNSQDSNKRDFAQSQRLTALAYVRPSDAARELALALQKAYQEDEVEIIRTAALIETFTEPLAEFEPLLVYARGMSKFMRRNLKDALADFYQLSSKNNCVVIEGVVLKIPVKNNVVEVRLNKSQTNKSSLAQKKPDFDRFPHLIDEYLCHIIKAVMKENTGSLQYNSHINELLKIIPRLPDIYRSKDIRIDYQEGLNRAMEHVWLKLKDFLEEYHKFGVGKNLNYDKPEIVRSHFVVWFNKILKRRLADISISSSILQLPISLDTRRFIYDTKSYLDIEEDKTVYIDSLEDITEVKTYLNLLADTSDDITVEREILEQLLIVATSWGSLGDIERKRGNWDAAERLYRQSLEVQTELGDRSGMATSIGCLGENELGRGNLETAEQLLKEALAKFQELGMTWHIAETNYDLAQLERRRNNAEFAEQHYQTAHQIFQQLGAAKDLERIEREWIN